MQNNSVIENLTELIKNKKHISPYTIFPFRNELRIACKNNKQDLAYLEQLIIEAELSLQNILYFYPYISTLD